MSKYSIGLDLGGTKMIAGVINTETGEIVGHVKRRTKKERGSDIIIQRVIETIERAVCIAQIPFSQIESIGLGLAGQVDREKGILISSPNLDCYDVDIKNILETHFNKPVFIGNDVEVATIGEMKFGSGVGYKNFVCIFVGTGVGSGIVQNGKIVHGSTGTAGEVGHMIVDEGGRACSCGGNGCLEAYSSRSAIERKIKASIKKGQKSIVSEFMAEDGVIRSKHIQQAIDEKDEIVLSAITEASEYLSSGLASVINFLNPDLIILGGGLVEAVDYLYDMSTKKALTKALPTPSQKVKITKTKLGDFSGIVGASLLKNYR